MRELCASYQNIDPVHELIPVRPVVHYMMGGIHTDIQGATDLAGLYAAGEVACVSINGANRLGSNSLPELLVFGARAGQAAADYVRQLRTGASSAAVEAQGRDEQHRLEGELARHQGEGGSGRDRIAGIRTEMQDAMEAGGRYLPGRENIEQGGRQTQGAAGALRRRGYR